MCTILGDLASRLRASIYFVLHIVSPIAALPILPLVAKCPPFSYIDRYVYYWHARRRSWFWWYPTYITHKLSWRFSGSYTFWRIKPSYLHSKQRCNVLLSYDYLRFFPKTRRYLLFNCLCSHCFLSCLRHMFRFLWDWVGLICIITKWPCEISTSGNHWNYKSYPRRNYVCSWSGELGRSS